MTHVRVRWEAEGLCQRCGRNDVAWLHKPASAKRYKNCVDCRRKVAADMLRRHHARRRAERAA